MINEKLIRKVIKKIVKVISPERIILFGSYAYGKPTKDSDLDLLIVVKESSLPRYKRSVPIYQALADLQITEDIVVYTCKEIDEWSEVPQAFISTIVRKGKVIYGA